MKNVVKLMISGLLLALLGACAAPSENKPAGNTNANTKAANTGTAPAAAAPSADVLAAIEKKSWEDWAKRDKAGVEGFLAAKFVSVGNSGASDRAESVKGWTEHKCEMSDLSFSDQKVTDLGDGIYLFTYKATVSAKCDGKPNPSPVNASTVYAKEGDTWKAMYYQEVPAPDAKGEYGSPSTPVDKAKELASLAAAPEDIVAVEKKLWETWKSQDSKAFEEHLSAKFVGNGRMGFADRATYLKNAFDPPCKVESATPGPMKALELSKDLTLIVYRAAQKGTCGKDALPANVMSVSIYRRENGKPMATYYMENPVK
jgi:ketosteroid isomerase-like protein